MIQDLRFLRVLSAWKAVAMAKVVYNEEQLAALVAKIARVVLEEVEGAQDPEKLSALDPLPKPRGRPRSNYTAHLHVRVLPGDAAWFQKTSDELGLQRGAFLSRIRKAYCQ
tara:strand:+ start:217 stop:549 length:333 start_codon:yes stop_codon:yes gene_type:complete